jgi:xanthine dehydrogenase YagR molybdenum-binding subunit
MKGGQARHAVADARAGDGTLVEARYTAHTQCHTALEPHAAVAQWDGGALTVHLSTQACATVAEDLATRFELRSDQVRVLSAYVGGGFGSKAVLSSEAVIAGELARRAQAPVRVVWDRAEELTVGGLRPGALMELRLAASADGDLAGLEMETWSDGGVSVGSSLGVLARIMYRTPEKWLSDYDVVTNAPPGAPFRGPGGPTALWALEQAIDEMALARREDPIAVRRRWDGNPGRLRLYDAVSKVTLWSERGPAGADTGRHRRGVGVAAAGWFYFVEPGSQVLVEATPDGRIVASTAAQDMGNGSRTVVGRGVAEVLGIPVDQVTVRLGDSHDVHGPMSGGSRTTASLWPTARDAAAQLRDALVDVAVDTLGLIDARAGAGGVTHAGGVTPWSEVLAASPPLAFVGRRHRDEGGYTPIGYAGTRMGGAQPAALQVTAVEVDTRLGRVRVRESWTGIAAGRILVPALARSQVEGSIVQGVGYALYEERRLDPTTGQLLTGNLEDYRLTGLGDIPRTQIHFDEAGFEHVTGGGVGLGEVAGIAVAASIGNAFAHATRKRVRDLPLRPDRVLGVLG